MIRETARRTLGLALLAGVLAPPAEASTVTARVCAQVGVKLDDSAVGDRWSFPNNTATNKPAGGFRMEVRTAGPGGGALVWPATGAGYAETSGTYTGCTPALTLDTQYLYTLKVTSSAKVGTNTFDGYDNETSLTQATVSSGVFTAASLATTPVVLTIAGGSNTLFNELAVVAYAASLQSAGVTGKVIPVYQAANPDTSSMRGHDGQLWLDDSDNKFLIAHELGHVLMYYVNGGHNPDNNTSIDDPACHGDFKSVGGHSEFSKEFQSAAGVEGIADFYSALIWNYDSAGSDCAFVRSYGLDPDLNGAANYADGVSHPCFGDPTPPGDWVTDRDWLENAVNAVQSPVDCTGTLVNRSTQYDWLRFLWAMRTVELVTPTQIWSMWNAADPFTWDPNGSTPDPSDDPRWRMVSGAAAAGIGTAFTHQADNGLDH